MNEEAKARGIQVVAELDTPGHSAAYTKYVHDHQEEVIKSLVKYGYLKAADYLNADGNVKQGSFFLHSQPWQLGTPGTGRSEQQCTDQTECDQCKNLYESTV